MRLYHHADPEAVQRIRQFGFRDVGHLVEGKIGVWLCSHGLHHRPGDDLVVVDLPDHVVREEWRTSCAEDPRTSDWVIPAAVLRAYGVLG